MCIRDSVLHCRFQPTGDRSVFDVDVVRANEGHGFAILIACWHVRPHVGPVAVHATVKNVHVTEKLIDEGRRRVGIDLVGGACLLYTSRCV